MLKYFLSFFCCLFSIMAHSEFSLKNSALEPDDHRIRICLLTLVRLLYLQSGMSVLKTLFDGSVLYAINMITSLSGFLRVLPVLTALSPIF